MGSPQSTGCQSGQPKDKAAQDSTGFLLADSSTTQAPTTEPATEPSLEPTSEPSTEPSTEPACEAIHGEENRLHLSMNAIPRAMDCTQPMTKQRHDTAYRTFSYAGYMGGISLPTVPVVLTLARASDNHAQIQSAIDTISTQTPDSNGPGHTLLRAGSYDLSGLIISASGVVVRGEGQGTDGTVLNDLLETQHSSIVISGGGSGIDEMADSGTDITARYSRWRHRAGGC